MQLNPHDTLLACCTPKETEAIRVYHYWHDRAHYAELKAAFFPTRENIEAREATAKMEAFALREYWRVTE